VLPIALVAALALTEPAPTEEADEPPVEETSEPAPAAAPLPPLASLKKDYNAPWRQGRSRLAMGGGVSGLTGSNLFYVAVSYGYFIVDNLELGVDALMLFGDQPFQLRVGPGLLYIVPIEAEVQPYVGAFYRHWFVPDDAFLDQDTLGGRLGLVLRSGGTFLQLGLVMESIISTCDDDCTSFYPELGFSISL